VSKQQKKQGKNPSVPPRNTAPAASASAPAAFAPASGIVPWVFAIAIVLLTVFAYRTAPDNQFVSWDDPVYVKENVLLTNPTPENAARIWKVTVSNNYHPLTMWSLLKNVQMSGLKAGPIITTNIFLHIAAALVLLMFLGQLTRGRWMVAGFTALLFAVHPMHVESVAWVSERKDVLYVFFGLWALLHYLYYSRGGGALHWGLTLVLFVLACLSKAMAVVFPVLMLLVDYWEGRSLRSARVWLEKAPFFAISLFFGLVAMDVQKGGTFHGWFPLLTYQNAFTTAFSLGQKIQFAGYGLMQYCIKLFVPVNLCTYYPYPIGGGPSAAAVMTGTPFLLAYFGVLGWLFWRGHKAWAFGLAWCLIAVSTVLQVIAVGAVIMADRYTYLAHIGLLFALFYSLDAWATKRSLSPWATWGLPAAFSLMCCFLTARQADTWQNSITLWSRVIDLYPNAGSPYNKRGSAWGKEHNDLEKAKSDFENAIRLLPNDAFGYEGLGIIAGMQNDHARALSMFSKCIELEPDEHNFYFNRGIAYISNKNPVSAVPDFEKSMALHPAGYDQQIEPYLNALYDSGAFEKVRSVASDAIKKQKALPRAYLLRAFAAYQMKDNAAALPDAQQAALLNPDNAALKQLLAELQK
jgi:protein O-mannosyl-transferase